MENPNEFEKDFGYTMFNNNRFNGNQLLLDVFIFLNSGTNVNNNLIINNSGKYNINKNLILKDGTLDMSKQAYAVEGSNGDNKKYSSMFQFLSNNKSSIVNIDNFKVDNIKFDNNIYD